ncbi:hypothetical protein WJX74_008645 [Apatococcus lobatus]|uniref:tRNA/rRNA methyltransferase SpoU type domain-containing protein n=1 Tax=Apatococcus lobatus TaxID=904363 RepID=A0AAW1Q9S2_9CHLO
MASWLLGFSLQIFPDFTAKAVIDLLGPLVTPERLLSLNQVVASRSFEVVPVVEGLYDQGNFGAVCRSAEGFGFGSIHVISYASPKFRAARQRNSSGAEKWLHVRKWRSAKDCIAMLKSSGFKVVATALSQDSIPISEVDWTQPTAVIFGNEKDGVTREVLEGADQLVHLPMQGFVSSFNISCAAAVVLWEARRCRLQRLGTQAELTAQQQDVLKAAMLLRHTATHGRGAELLQGLAQRRDSRLERLAVQGKGAVYASPSPML